MVKDYRLHLVMYNKEATLDKSILFFDIDGTILSEKTKIISENTKNAIKTARENGHLAFINTGRTLDELDDRILCLEFDGYVCGCGTYIKHNEDILLNTTLTKECMQTVIKDIYNCKLEACLEGVNSVYFDMTSTNEQLCRAKEFMQSCNCNLATFEDEHIDFIKFVLWVQPDSDYDTFYKRHNKEFTFINRGNNFIEVVPIGFSKATGIQYLLDYFNLSIENAYAFGDSMNDLPMLEYVPNSIAMGNSDPCLFSLVDYITKDVDENGISHALKHYQLI